MVPVLTVHQPQCSFVFTVHSNYLCTDSSKLHSCQCLELHWLSDTVVSIVDKSKASTQKGYYWSLQKQWKDKKTFKMGTQIYTICVVFFFMSLLFLSLKIHSFSGCCCVFEEGERGSDWLGSMTYQWANHQQRVTCSLYGRRPQCSRFQDYVLAEYIAHNCEENVLTSIRI